MTRDDTRRDKMRRDETRRDSQVKTTKERRDETTRTIREITTRGDEIEIEIETRLRRDVIETRSDRVKKRRD